MSSSRRVKPPVQDLPEGCEAISPRVPNAEDATFPSIAALEVPSERQTRPLKACIVTEDIVGPIRNGGIGTTYTHLSFLLADAGHDVTIIYPRGRHSENHTIEYWIDWYRERGVRFVPLELPKDVDATSDRWLLPMLATYDALTKEHFDLVHVSEWRGLAYLCLLAKKQGLAFRDTLFCVKTSSPYLWNREFMLEPVNDRGQLVKMFAERRSVELADMVIGGSRHLLVWMLKHGYKLPKDRTYVQPNVAVFAEIDPELRSNRPKRGTRVPINEIVFFGRLEGRKGLDVFCHALRKLHRDGVKLPKVTFLGKFGARIATRPELTIPQYIQEQASAWGVKWQILDNYRQAEAINYLLGEGRLAVMPSVIENSSLTVYEATHFNIPFVASDCGGNPELVAEEHRNEVLTPTHPVYLSEKLNEALEQGGFVAAPSFDNNDNLDVWRSFHTNVSALIDEATRREQGGAELNGLNKDLVGHLRQSASKGEPAEISVCLVLRDNHEAMVATLQTLLEQQDTIREVILVDDGSEDPETRNWLTEQAATFDKLGWQIVERAHYGAPDARNEATARAVGNYVLFLDAGTKLKPQAMEKLACAASHSGADVMLPFHEEPAVGGSNMPTRVVSIKGDPCFPFFNPEFHAPVVLVKREAFKLLDGFTRDYMVAGDVAELLCAATMSGMSVETVPEVLATESEFESTEPLNHQAAHVRSIRPYLYAAPLCLQPMLLAAAAPQTNGTALSGSAQTQKEPGASAFGLAVELARHTRTAARVRLGQARDELRRPGTSFSSRIKGAAQAVFRRPRMI